MVMYFILPAFFQISYSYPGNVSHFAAAGKSLPSCPTLYDPIDSSPPGSSVPGILQARYWSGLPFPPPMQACMLSHFSCARLCAVKFKTQKIYSELERIPNIPSTISSLLHTKLPQQ